MRSRPRADGFEKGLHFGCGFLFGGTVLVLVMLRNVPYPSAGHWVAVALGALLCGLLGLWGDRFYSLFRWW